MSRTDKDVPHWVSAEYYEPHHALRCGSRPGTKFGNEPCTLPARVVREPPQWGRTRRQCHWEPVWYEERRQYRYCSTWGPRKTDRHVYWWGPDRALVRDQLTTAKQQYNGSRDVENVERVDLHHHAPIRGGWWD